MNTLRTVSFSLLAIAAAGFATAQTPAQTPPAQDQTSPSAASTPHQQEATGKTMNHDEKMKRCVEKEQAANSSTTQDAAMKACKQRMSKQSDSTKQ